MPEYTKIQTIDTDDQGKIKPLNPGWVGPNESEKIALYLGNGSLQDDIPLEGILKYNPNEEESKKFQGCIGIGKDNKAEYVSFTTQPGIDGEVGKNYNLKINMENLIDQNDTNINFTIGNFFKEIKSNIIINETLNKITNLNPIINVPYKKFSDFDFMDLSYKQIIYCPIEDNNNIDKYEVKVRNSPRNIFDNDYISNKNNYQNTPSTSISTSPFFFYDKNISQATNLIALNKGYIDFDNNNDEFTSTTIENHLLTSKLSYYYIDFDDQDNNSFYYEKKIVTDTGTTPISFDIIIKNLKKTINDISYYYNFNIKIFLEEKDSTITNYSDELSFKKGTILVSYGKITTISNPIIGLSNIEPNNNTNNSISVETDFKNFLDTSWLDENGNGVPQLKGNIIVEFDTTVDTTYRNFQQIDNTNYYRTIVNDNEWDSFYSDIYNSQQYYIKTLKLSKILPKSLFVAIQSIYDYESRYDNINLNYSHSTSNIDHSEINNVNSSNLTFTVNDNNWTEIYTNTDLTQNVDKIINSQIYKIYIRKEKFGKLSNNLNYEYNYEDTEETVLLKIIYVLSTDKTLKTDNIEIDYTQPDSKYVNYISTTYNDEVDNIYKLRNKLSTGKSWGPYNYNGITALTYNKSTVDTISSEGINSIAIDSINYSITNLETKKYIISIKDHYSRVIDTNNSVFKKGFYELRKGYNFTITLKKDRVILDSKNVEVGYPSITFDAEKDTTYTLEVTNDRKFPKFLVNIAEFTETNNKDILKFNRGINFKIRDESEQKILDFYLNSDKELLNTWSLLENTGSSSISNNLDIHSVSFKINYEESNTVDLNTEYTFDNFCTTLNKFIEYTNFYIASADDSKIEKYIPSYRIQQNITKEYFISVNITVKINDDDKFIINDSGDNPVINLLLGNIYYFNQSDSSNKDKKLQLTEDISDPDNITNYTKGWEENKEYEPGDDGYVSIFEVPEDVPSKLYYYYKDSTVEYGEINIVNKFSVKIQDNDFFIDDTKEKELNLVRGVKYFFDTTDEGSRSMKLTKQNTTEKTQYTNGWIVPSDNDKMITFTVPDNVPDVLYYYSNDIDSVGTIKIVNDNLKFIKQTDKDKEKEKPFENMIYFPFEIPKYLYTLSSFELLRSKYIIDSNEEIKVPKSKIYNNNYYLTFGENNSAVPFPDRINPLYNCLVYELNIKTSDDTSIFNNIEVELINPDDDEKSYTSRQKHSMVLQLKNVDIPKTDTSSSEGYGYESSKGIGIDFNNLFDYNDFNFEEDEDEDEDDEDIFDKEFYDFINKNMNRSQKIKIEDEYSWISKSTENSGVAVKGTGDISDFLYISSDDKNKLSQKIIFTGNTITGYLYIGFMNNNEIKDTNIQFKIKLSTNNNKKIKLESYILSP